MADLGLSFVLLERAEFPDPAALIEAAAALGLVVTRDQDRESDTAPISFTVRHRGIDASLIVMVIAAPLPNAGDLPVGLATPSPDEIERGQAHTIITVLGLPEGPSEHVRASDTLLVKLTAAVIRSYPSPAIAAMLGHGVTLHRADVFTDAAAGPLDVLPMLVCVDVTIAPEADERISFLTHGLERYGREEFFVSASRTGTGAVEFLLSMVGWMLDDPNKHLPTGDTVGRSADELVTIQRVPSPIDDAPEVIRLDLDR